MTTQEAGWEALALCWECGLLMPRTEMSGHVCTAPEEAAELVRLTDKGVLAVVKRQAARRAANITASLTRGQAVTR